jgi:hypothetical protein
MKTNDEIRRHNLMLLVREVESQLGKERGAVSHLARISGVTKQQIGQVLNGATHANGVPKVLGSDSARALEQACDRPTGWLDVDHGQAEGVFEADMLDALRDCTPEDQAQLMALANRLRKPRPSAA